MIQSYHNTNKETGSELIQSKEKAMTQEESIEYIFYRFADVKKMTPSLVWTVYTRDYNSSTPITSIRRAINTLTNKGKLVKTSRMEEGMYGKQEHCWELPKDEDKQLKLL